MMEFVAHERDSVAQSCQEYRVEKLIKGRQCRSMYPRTLSFTHEQVMGIPPAGLPLQPETSCPSRLLMFTIMIMEDPSSPYRAARLWPRTPIRCPHRHPY